MQEIMAKIARNESLNPTELQEYLNFFNKVKNLESALSTMVRPGFMSIPKLHVGEIYSDRPLTHITNVYKTSAQTIASVTETELTLDDWNVFTGDAANNFGCVKLVPTTDVRLSDWVESARTIKVWGYIDIQASSGGISGYNWLYMNFKAPGQTFPTVNSAELFTVPDFSSGFGRYCFNTEISMTSDFTCSFSYYNDLAVSADVTALSVFFELT